jgi:hypothetical protein
MMHALMHPDMVYAYPIWWVGLVLAAAGLLGTFLLELAARRLLPPGLRRQHNDVAAAILAIIGVTYAVLLAFVAMLAWDGYNRAKAASSTEAMAIVDVRQASLGLDTGAQSQMRDWLKDYARIVIETEWPAQAQGHVLFLGEAPIARMSRAASSLHPATNAESNSQAQLLQAITRLNDARTDRLLAAGNSIPGIVWFVVCVGGTLTVAFCSFLGAPNARMQLAMGSVLALSGVLVLVMIIALSNPFRGDFRVSTAVYEHALVRLQQEQ